MSLQYLGVLTELFPSQQDLCEVSSQPWEEGVGRWGERDEKEKSSAKPRIFLEEEDRHWP